LILADTETQKEGLLCCSVFARVNGEPRGIEMNVGETACALKWERVVLSLHVKIDVGDALLLESEGRRISGVETNRDCVGPNRNFANPARGRPGWVYWRVCGRRNCQQYRSNQQRPHMQDITKWETDAVIGCLEPDA
jgi:hypothetical protein